MDQNEVRRRWAERSGEFSPTYYAYRGPDGTSERLERLLTEHVGRGAAVLELGCSAGRHLAHLHRNGFDDLHGVEVNPEAFDVMAEAYPDLADDGTLYDGDIGEVLEGLADDRFDAVFSVETLQHVPPERGRVFEAIARVTGELLVTVENEGEAERSGDRGVTFVDEGLPLFHRDWGRVFGGLGLVEVSVHRGEWDTTRAFEVS